MESTNNFLSSEHLALCPLDGRYKSIAEKLSPFFSEYALVKNRVFVELKWLEFLANSVDETTVLDEITEDQMAAILDIYNNFNFSDYQRVKDIESVLITMLKL